MAPTQNGRDRFLRQMRELGVDVSRETSDQLDALVNTLVRWQKAINLVGRTTIEGVWTRHVLDSAQLAPLIPAEAKSLADLGSGGGFPGLVLAALRPDLDMTLIEADARKAAFLGEAGRRMGLKKPPRVVIGRIEAAPPIKSGRRDGQGPGAARSIALLGGPTPDRYRYLPFPQGERVAGGIDRGHEGLGHSLPTPRQQNRP